MTDAYTREESDGRYVRLCADVENFRPRATEDHETAGGVAPGMVVREVRRRWRLGDELLRATRVVATAEEPADQWQ